MKITMDNLIDKIKGRGYWKMIIRPVDFQDKRIADKDTAAKIVEASKIAFRGWDYPHIDPGDGIVRSGPDSISSFCDWPEGGHFEFWKFYLNGQFVHYFSMSEDYGMSEDDKSEAKALFKLARSDQQGDKFLSIINTLYKITEMFFFAANLAKAANFGKEIEIVVEMGNVEGRTLLFWGQSFRYLSQAYTCKYQPIKEECVIQKGILITQAADLALDFTMDVFKEFNWKDANKNVFIGDQKRLIEHRL